MSKEQPAVSVITVVYNNREGFVRTAHSLLEQTSADWEWIVIDGGSTDGTCEAISQYNHVIRAWVSERDRGIYDAMNKGLARSSGKFVVFMNSGDRFGSPSSLATVCKKIRASADDLGMILGAARFELSDTYSYVQAPRSLEPYIEHSLPTSHQAMYFNRELHMGVLFDQNFRIAADYDAICRMSKKNSKAAYVPEVLAAVWRGLESNSLKHPIANIRDMATTQRRVLGLSHYAIFKSAVRRSMPVIAFRMMSHPLTASLTARLISYLRPLPAELPQRLN